MQDAWTTYSRILGGCGFCGVRKKSEHLRNQNSLRNVIPAMDI